MHNRKTQVVVPEFRTHTTHVKDNNHAIHLYMYAADFTECHLHVIAQAEEAQKNTEASASDRLAAQDKHDADVKDLSAKVAAAAAEKLALQRGFEVQSLFLALC